MSTRSTAARHASHCGSGSYTKYPEDISLDPLRKDIRKSTFLSLQDDIRAGFAVALLSIPQAIAYSISAGVPPSAGLLATIFGTIIAALLGSSRHLIIGPNNATVVLVQTAACEIFARWYAPSIDPQMRGVVTLELMTVLTMLIGLAQITAAVFKLGRVLQFVSYAVVVGYISGSALAITVDQLFIATGLSCPDNIETLFQKIIYWGIHLKDAHPTTVIVALLSLGFMLLLKIKNWIPQIPAPLVMLLLSSFLVWLFHLADIQKDGQKQTLALAGSGSSMTMWTPPSTISVTKNVIKEKADTISCEITPSFDQENRTSKEQNNLSQIMEKNTQQIYKDLSSPLFDLKVLNSLLPVAFAIAFIGMLETNSIAKSVAVKSGQRLTSSQEIFALGCSNFFISFLSALPCSGSMSRTTLNYDSGAKTRFSGVFSALFVAGVVLILGPFIAYVPQASLAAILLMTAPKMIDQKQVALCYRATKSDALVLAATFLGCIFFSLHIAFYMGVMLSIVLYLRKAATPRVVEYQYQEESGELKPLSEEDRHKPRNIRIINVEGELFFGAVDLFQYALRAMSEDDRSTKVIILRLKHVRDLDATAALALKQLKEYLTRKGRYLIVSSIPQHIVRFLENSKLIDHLGKENIIVFDENSPHSSLERAIDRAKKIIEEVTPSSYQAAAYVDPVSGNNDIGTIKDTTALQEEKA